MYKVKNNKYHCEDGPAIISDSCFINNKPVCLWLWNGHHITDIVKNLFGYLPDKLNKEQQVLLKLNIPLDYF